MASAVGSLFANLALNIAGFEKNTDKAVAKLNSGKARMNRTLAGIEKRFSGVGRVLGKAFNFKGLLVGSLTGGGFALLAKRAVGAADEIAKTADKIGIGTGALQELRFAADRAGVGQRTLDLSLQRFSRRVGEAAQGSGELKATLDQYNIALRDSEGRTRSLDAVLGDYAEAVKNAESDQERLRLAFKGFDSEGAALVNLLRDGRAGMESLRKEARALGIVLDESLIREAEKTSDALTNVQKIVDANLNKALLSLAPIITRVAEAFAQAAKGAGDFLARNRAIGDQATGRLEERLTGVKEEIAGFQKLQAESFATRAQAVQKGSDELTAQLDALITDTGLRLNELILQREALEAELRARRVVALDPIMVEGERPPRVPLAGGGFGRLAAAPDAFAAEGVKRVAETTALTERLAAVQKNHAEAAVINADAVAKLNETYTAGQAAIEAVLTPFQAYTAEVARLNELFAVGAIKTQEQYNLALEAARERFDRAAESGNEMARAMEEAGNAITNQLDSIVLRTEKASDAFKQLALDMARIALRATTEPIFTRIFSGLGNVFAGFFQHGGFIPPGKFGITGEAGPEPVFGGASGVTVGSFSNFALPDVSGGVPGAKTVNVIQNFDFRGADAGTETRLRQIAGQIVNQAKLAVREEVNKGGSYAKDVGRR